MEADDDRTGIDRPRTGASRWLLRGIVAGLMLHLALLGAALGVVLLEGGFTLPFGLGTFLTALLVSPYGLLVDAFGATAWLALTARSRHDATGVVPGGRRAAALLATALLVAVLALIVQAYARKPAPRLAGGPAPVPVWTPPRCDVAALSGAADSDWDRRGAELSSNASACSLDPSVDVRLAAADALARLPRPECRAALREWLQHERDGRVAERIRAALSRR